MFRYLLLLIIAVSFLAAGCRASQSMKDAWKGTRSYYYEYLNTPAGLNMDDKGDVENYQAVLGSAIADYDLQLQELERVLHNSDRNPDAAWVTAITTRFPWLSGVVLTDEFGTPQAKVPPNFPKPFAAESLLEHDPKQRVKDLRAVVLNDPLGPEIYLGNPVYVGGEFRGVIITHFDPRVLLARTGDPAKVMIAAPGGIIWPGIYDAAATPMAKTDWEKLLREEHSGILKNDLGSFYWISRYLGNLPLVYAIRIQGEFPLRQDNLQALAQANAFAIGTVHFPDMMPEAPQPPIEITPDGANSPLTAPDSVPSSRVGGTAMPLPE